MSEHLFKLGELEPQEKTAGGTSTRPYKKNFPALVGVSFYKLTL
ncbi:MAG TPA: hypothetical protein PLC42_05330 [Parachlamydiaceae bacterium]|nr:hypothetical protein [Parachlamydiaceae bacterium]